MTLERLRKIMCIPADESKDRIKERFDIIAYTLFNECIIKYQNDEYRILDFEFYFYNKNHQDISVHPRNSEALCWYINDFGGIDLNFESKIERDKNEPFKYLLTDESYFGGILIRQIKRVSDNIIFDGPWKVAELFRLLDATSQEQNNPILKIEYDLPLIDFKAPIERHNLLGSHKGTKEDRAKAKADFNIKECYTSITDDQKHELGIKLVTFSESKYRYCWKSK